MSEKPIRIKTSAIKFYYLIKIPLFQIFFVRTNITITFFLTYFLFLSASEYQLYFDVF